MLKVSIIVPNWNGLDLIGACLKSLEAQSYKAGIIVVENGSTDGSVEFIERNFPNVVLLKQSKNLGFTGGVNVGLRWSLEHEIELMALCNNDAVADKDWLKNLVAAAEAHKDAGIVVSKILQINKKHIDSTGELFYAWGNSAPRGRNEIDSGQYDTAEYVFGGSGGASAYSRELLEQIGLFDEDFFAYYEDIDMSFRAQLAGWKVYYEPRAVVYHHMNATSKKVTGLHAYNSAKNLPWVLWKNLPGSLLLPILPKASIIYAVEMVSAFKQGQGFYAFKGMFVSIILLPKKLIVRHKIQSNRKVSPAYIKSLFTPGLPPGVNRLAKFLKPFGAKV